jgi:hypothetical protein
MGGHRVSRLRHRALSQFVTGIMAHHRAIRQLLRYSHCGYAESFHDFFVTILLY